MLLHYEAKIHGDGIKFNIIKKKNRKSNFLIERT